MDDPLSDFDYDLPPGLIAQEPAERRESSRLLVLDRASGKGEHRSFREIAAWVRPGDVLVLNETRVFPARLRARRATGGRVEVLLLEPEGRGGAWVAMGRPGRALESGQVLRVRAPSGGEQGGDKWDRATIHPLGRHGKRARIEIREEGRVLSEMEVLALCERAGEVPLPPYIRREGAGRRSALDLERYQTIYARRTGAVAAPTAGLHFTREVLEEVVAAGARIARVTLHIGPGTFEPLSEEAFRSDRLHAERIEVPIEAGKEILEARTGGRRVIAVGTTSARVVESLPVDSVLPLEATTDLFIKPGYTFRRVDALITNFHLPRSSLLLLVAAFAGRERILECYREAIEERYRFYSYGDAMLIL